MNNRDYLRELVKLHMSIRSGMALWHSLNDILKANSNKINGLTEADRKGIVDVMDRVRRKHNREVYSQDDALKFQPWAQFTDAHGWTHIKNMRKHDNVPGERTE
jgi:hypothetical protein